MPKRFQAAALVAAPSYPSAIAWSDENLIAVASDHLVTILVNFSISACNYFLIVIVTVTAKDPTVL